VTLAVSAAASVVAAGSRAFAQAGWIRSGLQPKRWLTVLAVGALLIALPWYHVYWHPSKISTPMEPWFVAAKLGLIAILASVGWSLILRIATPVSTGPPPPSPQ
jgi:hypothetical protein